MTRHAKPGRGRAGVTESSPGHQNKLKRSTHCVGLFYWRNTQPGKTWRTWPTWR